MGVNHPAKVGRRKSGGLSEDPKVKMEPVDVYFGWIAASDALQECLCGNGYEPLSQ
jgi:hypothetical protein